MRFYRKARGGTNTVELRRHLHNLDSYFDFEIDFMQIGLAYACGWYANHLALREASCAGPSRATAAANGATQARANSGLGQFVHCPAPVNVVNCNVGNDMDGDGVGDFCQVTTTVQVQPMFSLPFVASTPITFKYQAVRPMEEKGLN